MNAKNTAKHGNWQKTRETSLPCFSDFLSVLTHHEYLFKPLKMAFVSFF